MQHTTGKARSQRKIPDDRREMDALVRAFQIVKSTHGRAITEVRGAFHGSELLFRSFVREG